MKTEHPHNKIYSSYLKSFLTLMSIISGSAIIVGLILESTYLMLMEASFALCYLLILFTPLKNNYRISSRLSALLFEMQILASSIFIAVPLQTSPVLYVSPAWIFLILFPILAALLRLSVRNHYAMVLAQLVVLQFFNLNKFFLHEPSFQAVTEDLIFSALVLATFIITAFFLRWIRKSQELTHRMEEEQKLLYKQLNQSKAELYAAVSHDLKSALSGILGFASLLKAGNGKPEKVQFYSELIYDATHRQQELLNDILMWSKSQLDGVSCNRQEFSINEQIRYIADSTRAWLHLKKINLHTELTDDLHVHADKDQISSVIRNLLNNAIKFTPEEGTITICSRIEKKFMKISVSDTGVGMDEKYLEEVLDPEKQISSRGTASESGSGLGVNLCRDFVEQNGGRFMADSTADEGSSFHFTLPLVS